MLAKFILSLTEFILIAVEFFIGTRIILKIFGASTTAPFVNWIYQTSQPLLAPFEGMFPSPEIEGGFILEFSAVFALLFYAFIAYIIQAFIVGAVRLQEKDSDSGAK